MVRGIRQSKDKPPDGSPAASESGSQPPAYDAVQSSITGAVAVAAGSVAKMTTTTTTRKKTVTKHRRRRRVKRVGSSNDQASAEEETSSELELEEEETLTSSHEHHDTFASLSLGAVSPTGIVGVLHQATITPNGAVTPTILVDKPLPDFPTHSPELQAVDGRDESRSNRRSATPPPRLSSLETTPLNGTSTHLTKSASVRKIRSFGDLLQARQAAEQAEPSMQRRASHAQLVSGARPSTVLFNLDARDEPKKAGHGLGIGVSPGKARVLSKRASSLGLVRRGSASQEASEPLVETPKDREQARLASNATAPPSTSAFLKADQAERKRKGSGFGFFSGFLRGKSKEGPITPPTESAESLTPTPSRLEKAEANTVLSTPESISPLKPESAGTPSSGATSRRYSIFPSFFRSSSHASAAPSTNGTLSPDAQALVLSRQGSNSTITPPLVSPSPQPDASDTSQAMLPDLANSRDSSMPQLPSIDRNLGDITFTGLFDFGVGSSTSKKGKRSRASTRSSIASLLSSSSQPGRLRSGSSASQSQTPSNVQTDYLSCKDGTLQRDKTITRPERSIDTALRPSTPPVPSLLSLERAGSVRHRVHRSNSASSVVPSRLSATGPGAQYAQASLSSRPSFTRSRSSSTVHSTLAASGGLRYHGSTGSINHPAYSPAITITGQNSTTAPPLLDLGLPPADDDFDFSFFAEIAARAGPPSSSGYSSSNAPTTPDMYMETDGLDGFGLSLPNSSTAIRFSTDSRGSSGAPSIMSTSSPSSTVGRPPSILQKTLRKRANTAGSLLSASMPASARGAPGSPSSAGVSTVSVLATRSGRSNSSSRLSTFLASPGSFLSSSPTTASLSGSANSPSWFSARESPANGLKIGTSDTELEQTELRQSPVSSQVGSPLLSGDGLNPWSSSVSINGAASATSLSLGGSRHRSGSASPAMTSSASLSPTSRLRSGSISAIPSRLSGQSSLEVEDDDTPASYVERLKATAAPSQLATLLASSADDFHLKALALHIQDFDFVNDPIDVALRKLLLGLSLPRETQQIDRVMEAFAARYNTCNPGLFANSDQPYILAFSMIMLHTDAYNKAAKSKMTKADYVKNTRIEGISSDLLECIYDNITFAPFVYAADVDGDVLSNQSRSASDLSSVGSTAVGSASGRDKSRLDIYSLIGNGLVGKLRLEAHKLVPIKNPYSYTGTVAFFDSTALHNAYVNAHILDIPSAGRRPSQQDLTASVAVEQGVSMKVTKVGILERKDDLLEGGKKAGSRKWKASSVLLSGTQLLFFKDPAVAFSLQEQVFARTGSLAPPQSDTQRIHLPALPSFRPDQIVSLHDAIALYDFTYAKYTNVFRLLQPNGRQTLFRAEDEASLNSWISIVNYGASFRTTGIRMRNSQRPSASSNNGIRPELPKFQAASADQLPKASMATTISASSSNGSSGADANRRVTEPTGLPRELQEYVDETLVFSHSTTSDLQELQEHNTFRHASRSDIIRSKVIELEAKIKLEQASLAADLRIVRNLAILTPFTSTARNKIEAALRPVADRIRVTRQSIAKLICYRECLCRDLLAAERDILREKQQAGENGQPSLLSIEQQQKARSASGRTADMARSASQDDLAKLARSPSLLKRSLTSTSEQAADFGSLAEKLANIGVDSPPVANIYSSSPSKTAYSPALAATPFEPVQEEEPGQTELASPVRDG